jgi:FkbM family methyltransferase
VGESLSFDYDKYTITTSVYDESFCMTIEESILEDEYGFVNINLKCKRVLDIGANIGDTAIKSIAYGAKSVTALEPIPKTFEFLKLNVEANNLSEKIQIFNYGLSSSPGKISIPIRPFASGGNSVSNRKENSSKKNYDTIAEVNLIDIKTLYKLTDQQKFEVVKIDCEGCEYELLRNFDLIQYFNPEIILIEYHNGFDAISNWIEHLPEYEIKWLIKKSSKLGLIKIIKKELSN